MTKKSAEHEREGAGGVRESHILTQASGIDNQPISDKDFYRRSAPENYPAGICNGTLICIIMHINYSVVVQLMSHTKRPVTVSECCQRSSRTMLELDQSTKVDQNFSVHVHCKLKVGQSSNANRISVPKYISFEVLGFPPNSLDVTNRVYAQQIRGSTTEEVE